MAHIERAAMSGHKKNAFYFEDDFIYSGSNKPAVVRDRSALPAASKNIDFVSSAEISMAILTAVEMSFSISKRDAISEALSMMGFQKATEKVSVRFEEIISVLETDGRISVRDNTLFLS